MFSILLFYTLVSPGVLANYNLLNQDYFEVDNVASIFEQFIEKYEKIYTLEEYYYRINVFKDTLKKLNEWNTEDPGTYGLQEFSDLTFEEISDKYFGFNGNISNVETVQFKSQMFYKAPEDVDWRKHGVVSPVKQQSRCGSCYAFSAIAHIESRYAMKYHTKPLILSEQQALDCDDEDDGCNGGCPHNVFSSLQEGVMLARDYPYVQRQGFCKTNNRKTVLKVNRFTVFKDLDEEDLKEAVASYGPLSIAMLFTHRMAHIKDGRVYRPVDCGNAPNNHAVLLVGYGQENDDYWIIKNSWGTMWGDKGYMRLLRGFGVCNIGSYVALAEVTRK
ncbi:ervatamin-B-like [Colias croceus]|uniref:ervatamin-B-like n=1 Tax=Colias crocea TaxID=72248 RepID=UPI001E27DEEF|nr:ervatamin-B-like [Colias croceus]